jgi:hypothetical protein
MRQRTSFAELASERVDILLSFLSKTNQTQSDRALKVCGIEKIEFAPSICKCPRYHLSSAPAECVRYSSSAD